uniref:CUB domain-containing protein n=1 Tax=Anopheles farauti TaxID=69004 RepID=A0A182Q0S8_9DIPT
MFENFENRRRKVWPVKSLWVKVSSMRSFVLENSATFINIELKSTQLSSISFGRNCSVEQLLIKRSKLTQLPKTINNLKSLERLTLIQSFIQAIDLEVIAELPRLHMLDLSKNRIHSVYYTAGDELFSMLNEVYLRDNKLRSINMNLFRTMASLTSIDLSHNHISVVSDFRISKYCGEHLIVGNEVHWEPLDGDTDEEVDESETAGSSDSSWRRQPPPPTDGIANGSANDAPAVPNDGDPPNAGGEDLRDGDPLVLDVDEREYAGSAYRRLVRAGGPVGEPRAEALQAATDFRVLKILPSNLDVVEDIKQIGNEYYFKKDVEVEVDDSENEIVGSEATGAGSAAGTTTTDGSELTETLDIVVLPAPTKDIEIYDNELEPDAATSARPVDDDISVIGLITPARGVGSTTTSMPMTSASGEESRLSYNSTPVTAAETTGSSVVSIETTLGHWDVDRLDLPPESAEGSQESMAEANRTGLVVEPSAPSPPFSFNNRTFQTIQETVRRQEYDERRPYRPIGGYNDEEDDFGDEEDEDDDDEDGDESRDRDYYGRAGSRPYGAGGRPDKSHKKYMSVQRSLLKHPLRQGFLMTPSYPKFYIGDSTCRWTLYAGMHQRIKLTVLDLALRFDEECRDYLQVVDLNTNHTLFHSCTESSRPIEIVSIQERLEISVRTTTKVIYPKRGVLIHYTALGCELPSPTPRHMRLVRRTEHRAKYVCDPFYVFPDTGQSVRELFCTTKHTWHRPLPACIGEYVQLHAQIASELVWNGERSSCCNGCNNQRTGKCIRLLQFHFPRGSERKKTRNQFVCEKRATEGSGLVSHYEQKRSRYGDRDNMSDKQADTVYDILIPSLIIAGLFVVNGIVFAVIMRYRNKRKQRLDLETREE